MLATPGPSATCFRHYMLIPTREGNKHSMVDLLHLNEAQPLLPIAAFATCCQKVRVNNKPRLFRPLGSRKLNLLTPFTWVLWIWRRCLNGDPQESQSASSNATIRSPAATPVSTTGFYAGPPAAGFRKGVYTGNVVIMKWLYLDPRSV